MSIFVFVMFTKKLLRYPTYNPLSTKSKNKDGKIIIQPNLKNTLTENTGEGKKLLFNCSFNGEIKTEQDTTIYVYNPKNSFRDGLMSGLDFVIEVVVSDSYNNIINTDIDMEIKRGKSICSLLDDMLDGYTVDDEKYSKISGNVKFKLVEQYENRVAKNNDYIVYSMIYRVKSLNERVDDI